MILASNRGFAEWADVFGDPVVATALLTAFCATPSSSRSRGQATASDSTPTSFRMPCALNPLQRPPPTHPGGVPEGRVNQLT